MKAYAAEKLRNMVLVGHGGSGKTSLAEAMLFTSGAITRLGKVDEGNTVTDFDPDEIRRKMSVNLSIAYCEWQNHKINILDTPGFADFTGEVKSGLHVADAAILVISAVAGVEVQTEIFWRQANQYTLPRLVFVNKMDRENADFEATVQSIKERLGSNAIAVQIPIGSADKFRGFVDLITMKAFLFADGGLSEQEIPSELTSLASSYREKLIEAMAESDDSLLEEYLEGQQLTTEEVAKGLRTGTTSGSLVPIVCGSALKNLGVSPFLDTILQTLPSPLDRPEVEGTNPKTSAEEIRKPGENEPFSSLVFKTIVDPYIGKLNVFRVYSGTLSSDSHVLNTSKDKTERIGQLLSLQGKKQEPIAEISAGDFAAVAKLQETGTGDTLCQADRPVILPKLEFPEPVISTAIRPKSKGDEDKLSTALYKLHEEDSTFSVRRDSELRQTILSGMGDTHLELIVDRLKRKFGVEAEQETLKIPYRETIKTRVQAEGKHKKQTGGHGQYGDAWIELEPLERGKGFEFVDKIFGGAIPRQYIPAVEKGVREAMVEGYLSGNPVVDMRVTVYDGSYHPVDSSEMAFKLAGSLAFRNAIAKADPVLLEPVLNVEVRVPEAYMGDIIGDLNSKRGKILGMEPANGEQIIRAQVPAGEMTKYANDLRSITQGRGTFKVEFSHYEEVPGHISQKIIEETKAAKQ
jgi:elongation factor G